MWSPRWHRGTQSSFVLKGAFLDCSIKSPRQSLCRRRDLRLRKSPDRIDQSKMTEEIIGSSKPEASRPEFFRLPSHGGDPYFGLTRSFYYEAEKRGYWRLVRLRQRGKLRGVTLVSYDAVAAFIRNQGGSES
jgi:hypothetical protein